MHITLISTTDCSIYIHCMFPSSHISLRKEVVNLKVVKVLHLLLPEPSLTSLPLSGSQLKLYQQLAEKIKWSAKPYPANREMAVRFLLSNHFS